MRRACGPGASTDYVKKNFLLSGGSRAIDRAYEDHAIKLNNAAMKVGRGGRTRRQQCPGAQGLPGPAYMLSMLLTAPSVQDLRSANIALATELARVQTAAGQARTARPTRTPFRTPLCTPVCPHPGAWAALTAIRHTVCSPQSNIAITAECEDLRRRLRQEQEQHVRATPWPAAPPSTRMHRSIQLGPRLASAMCRLARPWAGDSIL